MATSEASSAAFVSRPARLRLEQAFFPFMALLIVAAVLLGFARTFFLAPMYKYHLPNVLVAVHGVVFASWIALFAIQTSLVAAGPSRTVMSSVDVAVLLLPTSVMWRGCRSSRRYSRTVWRPRNLETLRQVDPI